MGTSDSKSYQLRVRVTAEERDLLTQLAAGRNRGETLSDLVREAISLLVRPSGATQELRPQVRADVEHLAKLLQRQPRQVEESCIQGILDLIEKKCEVPLIVMETQLHLNYRGHDQNNLPWRGGTDIQPDSAPADALAAVDHAE